MARDRKGQRERNHRYQGGRLTASTMLMTLMIAGSAFAIDEKPIKTDQQFNDPTEGITQGPKKHISWWKCVDQGPARQFWFCASLFLKEGETAEASLQLGGEDHCEEDTHAEFGPLLYSVCTDIACGKGPHPETSCTGTAEVEGGASISLEFEAPEPGDKECFVKAISTKGGTAKGKLQMSYKHYNEGATNLWVWQNPRGPNDPAMAGIQVDTKTTLGTLSHEFSNLMGHTYQCELQDENGNVISSYNGAGGGGGGGSGQ